MPDFVVKDKRLFDKEGHVQAAPEETPAGPGSGAASADQPPTARAEAAEKAGPLPPVTFAGFIFGLASSALIHLGEYPDPEGPGRRVDLPAARQTIDLLGLLEAKTKGNLDTDEAELLKHLLYDLRVKYVAAAKA